MNSRGGWKKYQKLIVVGFGIVGGLGKIESFNSRGGFFFSFSNHKNYSIKNISVCSKSKIKTKVTSKDDKSKIVYSQKFCNSSKMLLLFSWAIVIRALVFSSSPSAIFLRLSTFDFHFYSFFDSFLFCTYE